MTKEIRVKAAEVGADAVFIGDLQHYHAGTFTPGQISPYSRMFPTTSVAIRRKQLTAIAIVYEAPKD